MQGRSNCESFLVRAVDLPGKGTLMVERDSHAKRSAIDEEGLPLASPETGKLRRSVRREVLSIEDDISVSNVLFLLLEELDYGGEDALWGREVLATMDRADFDSILLDFRCQDFPLDQSLPRVTQLEATLVARVLVITVEAEHAEVLELLERHCTLRAPGRRLMDDVNRWLGRLRGKTPQHKTH